jgi:hypothetical protein
MRATLLCEQTQAWVECHTCRFYELASISLYWVVQEALTNENTFRCCDRSDGPVGCLDLAVPADVAMAARVGTAERPLRSTWGLARRRSVSPARPCGSNNCTAEEVRF